MEKMKNIVNYRMRLDKTLTSFDLTDDHKLKSLVDNQLRRFSKLEMEGYDEKLEIKTAELSNFLDMATSASVDENGETSTSPTDWKVKQDNDEFRVMFREGPEGTPYHTLLVEGYVDGPVDVSLCLSLESSLYKIWWPQFTIPTFKVTASDCLQKVQNGEQIALVRMKLPWPLSTREAIVHYYMFEYFQDDLIVILLKTVTESMRFHETIAGFNNDVIPEAKDIVRMDLVGGYVIQKVTSERSYFRAIVNIDIKLDFMPPSLINFISRQLIGNGFRLYQKAVASKMNNDNEFCKALTDSLYVRIHEALYNINGSNGMHEEKLKEDQAKDMSREDRSNQNANSYNGEILEASSEEIVNKVHDISIEEGDKSIVLKSGRNCEIVDADGEEIVEIEKDVKRVHDIAFDGGDTNIEQNGDRNCEIVDADSEETEEIVPNEKDVNKENGILIEEGDSCNVLKGEKNYEIVDADSEGTEETLQIEKDVNKEHGIPIKYDDTSVMKRKSNARISSNVKEALQTIERAISAVRKYGFHSRRFSFSFVNEETSSKEKCVKVDPCSPKLVQPHAKNNVSVNGTNNNNILQECSDDLYEIQNFRHTETDQSIMEVNYNKIVSAFSNQNHFRGNEGSHIDSYYLKNEITLDQIILHDNKQYSGQDMSSDVPKHLSKRTKFRYCCFLH